MLEEEILARVQAYFDELLNSALSADPDWVKILDFLADNGMELTGVDFQIHLKEAQQFMRLARLRRLSGMSDREFLEMMRIKPDLKTDMTA